MTLLVAPAGAGKTLAVGGWIRRATDDWVANALWLRADDKMTPETLATVLDEAEPPRFTDGDRVPRLVVIDEAHCLPAACVRVIDRRLNEAPDRVRLLLLSRWDLPLNRLAPELLGHLTALRGDVLRLEDHEAATLIREHARSDDPDVVRAITRRAQGWCAAVVLAARAVGAAPDRVAAARRYTAAQSSMADIVANEVFAALSPRQRHFLLCVAGETVVTASTAVHLSADPRAADILEELESTGLLVTRAPQPLPAETGAWWAVDAAEPHYWIHPLLAEVVRRRLVAGGVDVARARATVVRAVMLDLARGQGASALSRLLALNAPDEAADVLASAGGRMVLAAGENADIGQFLRTHPMTIESRPDTWFAVALDRWVADDIETARPWMERILEHESSAGREERPAGTPVGAVACVRLWYARLGLESAEPALENAVRVAAAAQAMPGSSQAPGPILPVLVTEIGLLQNWLGDLEHAEANLTTAIGLCRSEGLAALAACAMTHLAFTMYMAGRERACVELATEALARLGSADVRRVQFAPSRAGLALLLGSLVDVPWPTEAIPTPQPETGSRVHRADLCTKFWFRMRDARLALMNGSVPDAERVLTTPTTEPLPTDLNLPDHLRAALLIERAFLAGLSSDLMTLRAAEQELTMLRFEGEAALVGGLHADLSGDRRGALAAFEAAATGAACRQPPVRALALVCQAQLLDALGDPTGALERLEEAATETQVRRNAVPFLGWSRQGTPVATLVRRLALQSPSVWVQELAEAEADRPDIATAFASTTANPRERGTRVDGLVPPVLSPRERDVLNELARGSTYADIAATLFLSENTVKTHVSSLYGKLTVSRRSDALAVARKLRLL